MYATVITTLARRLISQFFWNSLKVYLMIDFYFERGGMQIFKHNIIWFVFHLVENNYFYTDVAFKRKQGIWSFVSNISNYYVKKTSLK